MTIYIARLTRQEAERFSYLFISLGLLKIITLETVPDANAPHPVGDGKIAVSLKAKVSASQNTLDIAFNRGLLNTHGWHKKFKKI